MFFGDNVGNTIQRLTNTDQYRILYRPHGSCFDHFIRHSVNSKTEKFFISNRVVVDNAINLIDSYSLEELLNTRLLVPYNFQICSNVNKNIEATLTSHTPLIYLIHTKEDLIDIENNILGNYPYIMLIANKALYDLSLSLDLDRDRVFYYPFSVQDDLDKKIQQKEKTTDVSIFLGGQDIKQITPIADKLKKLNLKVNICRNNFTSKTLINVFETSKIILEINPTNIYNVIYSINCGTPALIYNKDHEGNQDYIYRNFDEMISKITFFINKKTDLPKIGFANDGASEIEQILSNINNRGLIL
jgi:hypothetical protein